MASPLALLPPPPRVAPRSFLPSQLQRWLPEDHRHRLPLLHHLPRRTPSRMLLERSITAASPPVRKGRLPISLPRRLLTPPPSRTVLPLDSHLELLQPSQLPTRMASHLLRSRHLLPFLQGGIIKEARSALLLLLLLQLQPASLRLQREAHSNTKGWRRDRSTSASRDLLLQIGEDKEVSLERSRGTKLESAELERAGCLRTKD